MKTKRLVNFTTKQIEKVALPRVQMKLPMKQFQFVTREMTTGRTDEVFVQKGVSPIVVNSICDKYASSPFSFSRNPFSKPLPVLNVW